MNVMLCYVTPIRPSRTYLVDLQGRVRFISDRSRTESLRYHYQHRHANTHFSDLNRCCQRRAHAVRGDRVPIHMSKHRRTTRRSICGMWHERPPRLVGKRDSCGSRPNETSAASDPHAVRTDGTARASLLPLYDPRMARRCNAHPSDASSDARDTFPSSLG